MIKEIFTQSRINKLTINLLQNPDFEEGTMEPDLWTKFPLSFPGVTYTWDKTTSHTGTYSVCIESTGGGFGMWRQVVPVSPGRVYVLSGYVKFEHIRSPGYCNLQIVMRNKDREIIKFVDFPSHTGNREFAYDFPRELRVRVPRGTVEAEVNLFLKGPGKAWFDNILFGLAPAGNISGTVSSNGSPLEGARVFIWDGSQDPVYKATTDKMGKYTIKNVSVASPRYILLARKDGYKTKPVGNIDIVVSDVTRVDFELKSGKDPVDDLRIKFGSMAQVQNILSPPMPHDVKIDPDYYPESVKPYLLPDEFIQSNHPAVKKLAKQILESLPLKKRNNAYDVAYAIYTWISKNIEHDGVYTAGTGARLRPEPEEDRIISVNEDFKDITSGIWQTVTGEGWCWGRNFYDWAYKPSETLVERGVICVEHAWLAVALLRAVGIPARTAIGANQFWLQSSPGEGHWFNMSTTAGRTGYRERGSLEMGFGTGPWPNFFPVTNRPLLHENWNMENKCMWCERHPYEEFYEGTSSGLEQAIMDLEQFKLTGESPHRIPPSPNISYYYLIHYSDITLNLFNIGDQHILNVRFPFVSESATHTYMGHKAYWTSHPECVTRTWIEEVINPPVEGKERWFQIEFNLTSLLDSG